MRGNDCGCLLALVIGLFIGVILGVVYFFGFLPTIALAIWALIVLAAVFLVLLVLVGAFGNGKVARCICGNGNCLLAGIIGTIILGIIALAVGVATATIATAIIVGLFGLFATLFIIALIILVMCIIEANCRCRE